MIGAIDIGGTKIAVGMVAEDGRILAQASCPSEPRAGFTAAVERMDRLLRQTASEAGGWPEGVGIGCTGPVDPFSGRLCNVDLLPTWEGQDLVGAVAQVSGVPAALENDADAAALGELAWGAGREAGRFLLVTIGTGIGVGVILDGKIYRGVDGAHPEIGHHVIEASGPLCVCGVRGCWEALASGPAMETWFRQQDPSRAAWDGRRICAAADAADPLAREAVEREAFYLGTGLANLVNLFCPEAIALGGGLMERFDLFEARARATIQSNCAYIPLDKIRIEKAALGNRAGLLGAAQVWIRRITGN
jgi:glucokinase